MSTIKPKLFMNRRLFAVLVFGFSSGLPFALTSSTLQAWFTEAHINLVTIGALSLLGLPYALKFLWAPLMDYYCFSPSDKWRYWIFLTQIGLVIGLILLANMNPSSQVHYMAIIAFIIAFFSASQDVVIDAYRTDVLPAHERGLGAAYTVFSYRIAVLMSGGFALIFADFLGWKITYEVMAIFILLSMIGSYIAPKAATVTSQEKNVLRSILAAISDLLQREKIGILVLFIVFYKIGDALALSLFTNFLLRGLGFSLTEVGLAYKIVSFIATVSGAFIGGLFLTRLNLFKALLWFGLAQGFSNLMFVVLAMSGKVFSLMALSIFIENFCSGMSTAAFFAFLMSLCNHRYTAFQYALLSAIASLGRIFLGPVAGILVENFGWVNFYMISVILSFPGILFLILLKDRVLFHAQVALD